MLSLRERKILEILLNKKDYIQIKHFSDLFKLSKRTISTDFKRIDEVLQLNKLGFIIRKPGKGVRIQLNDNKENAVLVLLTPTEQEEVTPQKRRFTIIKWLLLEEELSYQKLADTFFISRSSIATDMKCVKKFFSADKEFIYQDYKGTHFYGTELERQQFLKKLIFEMFWDRFNSESVNEKDTTEVLSELATKEIISSVVTAINNFSKQLKKPISEYFMVTLEVVLTILIVRGNKNHHIEYEDNKLMFERIGELETYIFSMSIVNEIQKNISYSFSEEDILYLNKNLIAVGIQPISPSNHVTQLFIELIKKSIEKMSEIVEVDLYDDRLLNGLITHIIPLVYRMKNNLAIKNPLLSEIKKEYPIVYSSTWFVMMDIEKELGISLSEDEIGFIAVHFQAAIERHKSIQRVLIVCPNGIGTSRLLSSRIKRFLPVLDTYDIISLDRISKVDLKEVDFIISTIPIASIEKPIIQVSPLLTQEDIKKISDFYTDLVFKDEKVHNSQKDHYLFNQYLDEKMIFTNQNFESKEEVIRFLGQKLYQLGYVDENYIDSVLGRESLSPTGLHSGAAIPHGNPNNVNKSIVSIVVNSTKISWGEEKVDVIILLTISKKDVQKIESVLERVFEMIENRQTVEKAYSDKSSKDILNIIIGGSLSE